MAYVYHGPTRPLPAPPPKVTPRPLEGRENDRWVHVGDGININMTRLDELAAGQP